MPTGNIAWLGCEYILYIYVCLDGYMDIWMDRCISGWMDYWEGEWICGWLSGCLSVWMYRGVACPVRLCLYTFAPVCMSSWSAKCDGKRSHYCYFLTNLRLDIGLHVWPTSSCLINGYIVVLYSYTPLITSILYSCGTVLHIDWLPLVDYGKTWHDNIATFSIRGGW
jgi:hypothetical protein